MTFHKTRVKCRSNQTPRLQKKKATPRKVQSLAKGHKASRSGHSLSKSHGSLTPCPMSLEAPSHYYDYKRIFYDQVVFISLFIYFKIF